MNRWSCVVLLIVFCVPALARASEQYLPPDRVQVLPLFFVTGDGRPPTSAQTEKLMRHVKWAQSHYREMLGGRDTFQIADRAPAVYRSKRTLAFYRSQKRPAVASGETQRSEVANVVHKRILPSRAGVGFNPNNMWHSGPAVDGWVSITIIFPFEVELTKIRVHSQHRGTSHAAEAVRVEAMGPDGFQPVVEAPLPNADSLVQFTPTKARQWQIHFQAGRSGTVVIRGLRFYQGDRELFPPVEPY